MENSIPEGKSRVGWFDAMRGLAIIAVVLGHVLYFNILEDRDTVLFSTIVMFHMPLFFLISGFFGYKTCESWTLPCLGDFLKRKFQALIICAVVFFGLYHFCHGRNVIDCLLIQKNFSPYWFTFVLFEAFVIFLVLSLLSKLFKSERILEAGLIIIAVASVLVLAVKPFGDDCTLWKALFAERFCKEFQFFVLGIFCRKYQTPFESILSKNWFKAGITICTVACLVLYYCDSVRNGGALVLNFVDLVAHYIVLLLVVAFFFAKREFFEAPTLSSSALRYIGRRTLDIYMLHWFFLPNLKSIAPLFAPNNMLVFQLFLGLAVSLAIIALCMLPGEIVRMSDFLSAWLFGVKYRPRC